MEGIGPSASRSRTERSTDELHSEIRSTILSRIKVYTQKKTKGFHMIIEGDQSAELEQMREMMQSGRNDGESADLLIYLGLLELYWDGNKGVAHLDWPSGIRESDRKIQYVNTSLVWNDEEARFGTILATEAPFIFPSEVTESFAGELTTRVYKLSIRKPE